MQAETIIKLICRNNGDMNYDLISDSISEDVDDVINGNGSLVTLLLNGQKTVLVQGKLKLCRAKDCGGCNNLHLCKFYLLGYCQYGRGRRGCRFSHDLMSPQNAKVLRDNGLNHLNKRELCILLLQSDKSLLPEVCHSYNNGTGLYGRCPDAENCKRMHICEKYLRGPCECSRGHDFYEPQPLKTLQDRGVPTELMPIMKTVYSNIEALRKMGKGKPPQRHTPKDRPFTADAKHFRSSQPTAEKTEICMYFVKGSCKHGDRCSREHTKLPYKWEIKTDVSWVALPENDSIEKDYCDPAKTYSSGICFDTMTRGSSPVRRLSTVSSVLQPNFILTTTWAWYWEDEYGNWIQYSSATAGHNTASITSEDLEQKYLQDNTSELDFTAGSQSYTLNFQDMIQTNKKYRTKKVVRRRPLFVSAAEAQTIRTSKPAINNQMKSLPSHWSKAMTPEIGYKRVLLQSDSTEYQHIQTLFNNTMRGFTIQTIERIQNKVLWEVFQWQKDLMKKRNVGRNVEERQLFHGTDDKHIEAICNENIDWRICGTHGTAYGKGSYFARDANYSHSYTGDTVTRNMFVCRVLVGDYTLGNSSYVRAPYKDGGDTFSFDSCVNDSYNPSIFVVFEKHQIYPEYLIKYREATRVSSSYYRPTPAAVNRTTYSQPAQRATPVYQPRPAPVTYSTPSYSYTPPPAAKPSKSDCIIC